MDFEFSGKTREYLGRLGAVMDAHVYPNEQRYREELDRGGRWQEPPLIGELQEKARAASSISAPARWRHRAAWRLVQVVSP